VFWPHTPSSSATASAASSAEVCCSMRGGPLFATPLWSYMSTCGVQQSQ
jgi:hypothetical protein